jgi:hypothetical protein
VVAIVKVVSFAFVAYPYSLFVLALPIAIGCSPKAVGIPFITIAVAMSRIISDALNNDPMFILLIGGIAIDIIEGVFL